MRYVLSCSFGTGRNYDYFSDAPVEPGGKAVVRTDRGEVVVGVEACWPEGERASRASKSIVRIVEEKSS